MPTSIPVQWLLPVTMLVVLNIGFVESSSLKSNSCNMQYNVGNQKDPRLNIARTPEVKRLQKCIDSVVNDIKLLNEQYVDIQRQLKSKYAVPMSLSERDRLLDMQLKLLDNMLLLRKNEEHLRAEKLSYFKPMDSPDQLNSPVTCHTSDGDGGLQLENNEQVSASLLTATQGSRLKACLYNGMKAVFFNLPGVVKDIINQEVDQVSVESARKAVRKGLPRTMLPEKVSETITSAAAMAESKLSIESTTGLALQTFFTSRQDPSLCCNFERCLSDFGAVKGPVTGASKPDALVFSVIEGESVPFAIVEFNDNICAPVEQTGQAFGSGANIARRQEALGLDSSVIAVPLIMTNGQLYLFAAVSLLDTLPVLHILSDVLDANNKIQFGQIADSVCKIRAFIVKQVRTMQAQDLPIYKIQKISRCLPLDAKKFFFKPKDKVFNRFMPLECERGALPHLWDVYEALSDVDGAVKALGYGDFLRAGTDSAKSYLVFKNLNRDGYVMGVPVIEERYKAFLAALESLLHQIHSRGVIHVDLYPSNILWAYIDGKIQVRIIDWDGAMFVDEDFPHSMLNRFRASPDQYFLDSCNKASPRNDAWHLFILSELSEAQRSSLQGATAIDAPKVIMAYMNIVTARVQQMGQHRVNIVMGQHVIVNMGSTWSRWVNIVTITLGRGTSASSPGDALLQQQLRQAREQTHAGLLRGSLRPNVVQGL